MVATTDPRIEEIEDPRHQVLLRNYRGLLDAQTKLREVAERQARDARAQVIRVVTALCPIVLERIRRKDPRGVDKLSLKELADLAIDEIRHVLDQTYFAADVDFVVLHRKAEEEVERLKRELAQRGEQKADLEELEQVKEDLAAARAEADQQRAARHKAEKALEEAQAALVDVEAEYETAQEMYRDVQAYQASPPTKLTSTAEKSHDNGAATAGIPEKTFEPEWVAEWRGRKSFKSDSRVILALGATGECRRNHLVTQIANQHSMSPQSGTFSRVFPRLVKKGFIEVIDVNPQILGNGTSLVQLTPLGRDAYRNLAKQAPESSSLDQLLARHRSPEHAYLNLMAVDLLRDAGYSVNPFPEPRTVSAGNFVPDLQAILPEGKTIWIEVECDTNKSNRANKWEIYYEASEGHFVIVTDNKSAMKGIQSEIMAWIGSRPLILWMTNVSDLLSGKHSKTDGNIWFVEREL